MARVFVVVFLLIQIFSFRGWSQSNPKGKLFIIGGGTQPENLVSRMFQEAGITKEDYVIVLPMSSEQPDSAIMGLKFNFAKHGVLKVAGIKFGKDTPNAPRVLDSISRAKLIYISGGDQQRFMAAIDGTDLLKCLHKAYQNGAVIAGTSAGAALMSKVMITGNQLKYPQYASTFASLETDNLETTQGLGLLPDVIVDQHFVKRSRYNRLLSAVIENPDMKGIGIDESTAILVKGNEAEVVGISQVIVFKNRRRTKIVRDNKLGAEEVVISIKLPGDKFKLR